MLLRSPPDGRSHHVPHERRTSANSLSVIQRIWFLSRASLALAIIVVHEAAVSGNKTTPIVLCLKRGRAWCCLSRPLT